MIFRRILWRSRTVWAFSFRRPVRLPPARSCSRTVAANRSTSGWRQRSAMRADGLLQGGAIGDLVGGHAELRADRVGHLAADQGDGGGHRVAGLQAADDDLQRLRQLEAQRLGARSGLELQVDDRPADPEQPAAPTRESSGLLVSTSAASAAAQGDGPDDERPALRIDSARRSATIRSASQRSRSRRSPAASGRAACAAPAPVRRDPVDLLGHRQALVHLRFWVADGDAGRSAAWPAAKTAAKTRIRKMSVAVERSWSAQHPGRDRNWRCRS